MFYNVLHCKYMQCRGDWKVARASTGRVCAAIPNGDDLTCSRGLSVAIPTESMPPAQGFRQESSWFVEMIPTETIFFLIVTVGIAALNPRLNMDYPPGGGNVCVACISGELPLAPTATR